MYRIKLMEVEKAVISFQQALSQGTDKCAETITSLLRQQ